MGILDNLENAWEKELSIESKRMPVIDNMGREIFWEDNGRPENDGLALKMFKEECCSDCDCSD